MSSIPDPDEHFRKVEGADMLDTHEWSDAELERIFGPLTFRERAHAYLYPEGYVAVALLAAVVLVKVAEWLL